MPWKVYFIKRIVRGRLYALFGLFVIFPAMHGKAQVEVRISGTVFSQEKRPLSNASVYLKSAKDSSLLAFSITKPSGVFYLQKNIKDTGVFLIIVSHIGFQTHTEHLIINAETSLPDSVIFYLLPSSSALKEIVINSANQKAIVKKDTIEFSASAYITPEVAKVEDLLKNMQGFVIDERGRISFNGKEVEKIFVDGDDLTGNNYQFISRNLNASLVSKVQVVNNFNDNRLLAEVEQSETVALNLKMNEQARNKLSGSFDLGASFEKRFIAENSTLLLTQKIKSLFISGYNNVSASPMSDIQYHFKKEDASGSGLLQSDNNERQIVGPTGISLPTIGKSYTNNNSDAGIGLMQSFRISKAVKIKFLIVSTSDRLENENRNNLKTFVLNNSWSTQTNEQVKFRQTAFYSQWGIKHDNLKKNTGSYDFFLERKEVNSRYGNITSIDVRDTLHEVFNSRGLIFRMNGSEVFLLKKKRLLTIDFSVACDSLTYDFDVNTHRYTGFFNLDSTFVTNKQATNILFYKADVKVRKTGKLSKNSSYNYGIYSELRQNEFANAITNRSRFFADSFIVQPVSKTTYNSQLFLIFGQILQKLSSKSLLNAAFNVGHAVQQTSFGSVRQLTSASPFKLIVDYRYNFSGLKVLSADLKTGMSLPDARLFFGSPVLSGGVSIQNGAQNLFLTRYSEISVSYMSSNIYSNSSFFVTAFLTKSDRSYSHTFNSLPDYSVSFFIPLNNNLHYFVTVNTEKYIPSLKSKFILNGQLVRQAGNTIINNAESRTTFNSFNLGIKYISAFTGKLNFEAGLSTTYLTNDVTTKSLKSRSGSFWQYYTSGKIKLTLSKKIYFNLFYSGNRLTPGNYFQILDGFINYKAGAKVSFSVKAHNILNTSAAYQRWFNTVNTFENAFRIVGRYFLIKTTINF
jgi:hypothetical protein